MPVTLSEVRQLRTGAKHASSVNLHRLARLLEGLADAGQMVLDGSDLDLALTLPDLVERGAVIARDLSRDVERMDPLDTELVT